MKKLAVIFVAVGLLFPFITFAKIGVGVGTGKINVDQPLRGGLIYALPNLTVINTGDEPSDYGVGIQYLEGQKELKASKEWFSFSPSEFHLEPGKAQSVEVKLVLPVDGAVPGDYFVFLQGFPVQKTVVSGTTLGIAAASKLYFTVAPSSFFSGVYYRAASLLTVYSPWSYIAIGVIILLLIGWYLSRYMSIGVSFKKKKIDE